MKRKKDVRKNLKKYEDRNDEQFLNEEAVPYITKNRAKEIEEGDDLSEEQGAELDKAFEEMENGEYATMADFKKAMSRWLTK